SSPLSSAPNPFPFATRFRTASRCGAKEPMTKNRILATALAFATTMAIATLARAQEAQTIRGTLRDATTGKPIPGASVFDKETGEAAITADDGSFELFQGGDHSTTLVVIDPSYKRTETRYDGVHAVAISLEPVSVRGDEVVVEVERERTTAGESTLKREELMRIPGSR